MTRKETRCEFHLDWRQHSQPRHHRAACGHTVVINSLRVMPTSLHQLTSLGIDPEKQKVITVKGVTAPLAAYAPIATEIIAVDSPGATQAAPEAFVYTKRPRPLFPLDGEV